MPTEDEATGLGALRAAYITAAHAVESASTGHEAVLAARTLADELATLSEQASDLRARMVVRMADEEALSLAPLAAKLSVSKERAGQLVRKGRALNQGQKEGAT